MSLTLKINLTRAWTETSSLLSGGGAALISESDRERSAEDDFRETPLPGSSSSSSYDFSR